MLCRNLNINGDMTLVDLNINGYFKKRKENRQNLGANNFRRLILQSFNRKYGSSKIMDLKNVVYIILSSF